MDNEGQQPRQPRNLQGLLRFAMDTTRSEDAPSDSHFAQMDPERRQFLEEALKSLTVNVVEQLENAVRTITDDASTEDEILEAMDVISEFVQDIDAANDFFKVGGFCILNPCLASPHASVKSATLLLVRDLAQNNPFCQEQLLAHGILDKLLVALADSSDQVSCDAMSAISALVRAYEPGLNAFLAVGGLECMLGCIGDEGRAKLQIRVAFLISTITSEYPHLVDQFIQLDAIERISPQVKAFAAELMKLENFLSALASLTTIPEGVARCQSNELNLQKKLEEVIRTMDGKDECLEIVEHARTILGRISESPSREEAER